MTHDDLLRDMDWARKSFEDAGVHGTEGARQIIEAAQAIRDLQAQNAKLREALWTYETKVQEYASDNPAVSDCAYDWLNEDAGQAAATALEDTK